jgi:uncharacterized membrane protein (UPF0182 family)
MFGIIKMAAVSFVLSYGAVTVYNLPVQKLEAAVSGKYQDRIPASEKVPVQAAGEIEQGAAIAGSTSLATKGDRLTTPVERCVSQTWPYVSEECGSRVSGTAPKQIRVISIESRAEGNKLGVALAPRISVAQR